MLLPIRLLLSVPGEIDQHWISRRVVWGVFILFDKSSILLLVSSILADSDLTISSIHLFVSSMRWFVLSILILKSGELRPYVFQLVHDDAEVEDEDVPAPSFLPYLILPKMCSAASLSA